MNQSPDKNQDPLKKLLNKGFLEQPSSNFSASVFDKLNIAPPPSAIKYEPVISSKGWIFIAMIVSLILWLASSREPASNTLMIDHILNQTIYSIKVQIETPFILIISMLSISVFVLFSIESLYRQSRLKVS